MPIKFISATPAGLAPSSSCLRAGIDGRKSLLRATAVLVGLSLLVLAAPSPTPSYAQEQTSSAGTAHEPLSEQEMEVLVARIALYPDELVAAIAAASLYPLQIVEAERYLERVKTEPELKPDKDWDGSVISLMNYPEIVKMMRDDLEWTQHFGEAVAYQQKDMLEAIQQLRERAVANQIIKSDDKTVIVREHEKVIIKPAQPDKVYIPVYRSEDLYELELWVATGKLLLQLLLVLLRSDRHLLRRLRHWRCLGCCRRLVRRGDLERLRPLEQRCRDQLQLLLQRSGLQRRYQFEPGRLDEGRQL